MLKHCTKKLEVTGTIIYLQRKYLLSNLYVSLDLNEIVRRAYSQTKTCYICINKMPIYIIFVLVRKNNTSYINVNLHAEKPFILLNINCIFTSCDLHEPHYYFGSKKMKIIDQKEQIIAKPMILYIQDFPAITLPFSILPNSSGKQKSGFIMPSFGHSSESGTWIEDLGYYYAPNDYYDIIIRNILKSKYVLH